MSRACDHRLAWSGPETSRPVQRKARGIDGPTARDSETSSSGSGLEGPDVRIRRGPRRAFH